MGIAAGDFDRDGTLDVTITNFEGESCNMFLQSSAGLFRDDADTVGLSIPTENTLGFGVQAVDFDNDGFLDIARLNGHIYDQRESGIPFRMAPQLFRGTKSRFLPVPAKQAGAFWEQKSLGRTLASLDFNNDGRVDLLANSLDQNVALLKNESDSGNWIEIKLVGTQSERDAIGAKVTVRAGDHVLHGWQTSGGYMNHDENVLRFGLAEHKAAKRISVKWPSGVEQEVGTANAGQSLIVVENQTNE